MYKMNILIKNGRIWDGNRFINGDVAMNEKEILAVGSVPEDFKADAVWDANGDIVAPGLTDVHTHLKYMCWPTYQTNAEVICFTNGVTSAAEAATDLTNDYLSYTELNIQIFIKADIKNGRAELENTKRLLEYYGDKAIGIKVFFDRNAIGDCTVEPLRDICNFAHDRGLKVMVHSSNSPIPMAELLSCLQKGDICTHIYHGGVHHTAEDNFESLKEARSRGVILDAGLAGGVHTNFEFARKAIECGAAPDTISTDITNHNAFKRGGKYGMTYAMSMLRHFGMAEEDIMRAVTTSAAKAVNLDDRCGILAPGRRADATIIRYTRSKMDITDKQGNVLKADEGYVCMLTICNGYHVYRSDLFEQ